MASVALANPQDSLISSDSIYIYTDIETDSVQANTLLQIAAVSQNGDIFNTYIDPQRPLSQTCTNFLGLYYFKGNLYRDGLKLKTKNIVKALILFMAWISDFKHPVILIFHNGFSFDCTVLAKFLVRLSINIPSNLKVVGDTLPYIRSNFQTPQIENHKLGTLAGFFDIHQEHAHDALSDSLTLKLICDNIVKRNGIDYRDIFKDSCRPFSDYLNKHLHGTPVPPLKKIKKKTDKVTVI